MLYDKEFLLELDKQKHKTIYARITSLRFNESPIESIEGRVTGGSINLDGASAMRRTCSLTMTAENFNHSSYTWGLNTKFKLEIGVRNFINLIYPDIIWFNQGIYLITSFSTSNSSNSFSVSISGKDKMCLLNGEIGGSLESSVDFGTIEEENADGVWTIRKIPIPEIIRNLVHTYAKEPYHNIIINDLDMCGLELLEYRYETPMFLYREYDENDHPKALYTNAFLDNKSTKVKLSENGDALPLSIFDPDSEEYYDDKYLDYLDPLVDGMGSKNGVVKPVWIEGKKIQLTKLCYGNTAGYRSTELTYAGDLIANIGESITSVLDKIRNMLVEYEYFYDVDGRFIFQKKQSYVETMWGGPDSDGQEPDYYTPTKLSSATSYTFSGGELITAFNNSPNLTNLRNDYSIWGERTGISGAKLPVHMRYAIDVKPIYYKSIAVKDDDEQVKAYNEKYGANLRGQKSVEYSIKDWDWREIIYQMAKDYYRYNILDDFEIRVIQANPHHYPTGITGYEAYYIDLQGFWRELYNPEIHSKYEQAETDVATNESNLEIKEKELSDAKLILKDAEDLLKDTKESDGNYMNYYNSVVDNRAKVNELQATVDALTEEQAALKKQRDDYKELKEDFNKDTYWNINLTQHPENLNFWFDFLDTEGELQQFNVKNIGARPKAINDTNVKSIYFRDTPNVIFYAPGEEITYEMGYTYVQAPEEMFSISAQGKSAKTRLDELIYQHGYCIESASITAIPIYYLEPNTRVYVYDEKTGIDGEYVVSKITLPLTYNGTMSLTATRAAETII